MWAPPPIPATAGFSLQKPTGLFAYRSRGWENANYALLPCTLYPHDNKNSRQTPEHIENHIIQFAKEVRMVLALGGGAVMQAECEEMVHSGTLCIYLRASVDTLVERLTGEDSGRPLLSGADPGRSSKPSVLSGGPSVMSSNPTVMSNEVETSALRTRILELMRQRSETYERVAHLIVDTDGKSVGEIAEEITRFHV